MFNSVTRSMEFLLSENYRSSIQDLCLYFFLKCTCADIRYFGFSSIPTEKGDSLVSFSALDEVSNTRALQKKTEAERADKSKKQGTLASGTTATALTSGGITMTAVERAIESLAALVGKSYIKEEIVHGSYRWDGCLF
jgi:hypothetical protein